MEGLKHFVIGADGKNIKFFPDLKPFGRRQRFKGFIRTRHGATEVFQKDQGDLSRQLWHCF